MNNWIIFLSLAVLATYGNTEVGNEWTLRKLIHRPRTLSKERLQTLCNLSNMSKFKSDELQPFMKPRISGTPGNREVQEHIIHQLQALNWSVDTHSFDDNTPYGKITFNNIVGTLNTTATRRLVLACHFDSKYFDPPTVFIGATDSAVPCAMMLDLIRLLDPYLKRPKSNNDDLTLQLIFFDGEEAFLSWTATDSLYGSRKLAEKMEFTLHPSNNLAHTTQIDGIDLFVLLDLIGAANPHFYSFFENTGHHFTRLVGIEKRLHQMNCLSSHIRDNDYFMENSFNAGVEDDHIPFLRRGVRVLHLIPTPFPSVWHTPYDNEQALDYTTIDNLSKIMRVFVAEYLRLRI